MSTRNHIPAGTLTVCDLTSSVHTSISELEDTDNMKEIGSVDKGEIVMVIANSQRSQYDYDVCFVMSRRLVGWTFVDKKEIVL